MTSSHAHAWLRRVLVLAALAVIFVAFLPASKSRSAAIAPATLSGAYTGPGNATGLNAFARWRGSSASVTLDYLTETGWQGISSPSWNLNAWRTYRARGGTLVLSVPMIVQYPAGTFQDGADGDYDKYYETLGRRLVADGEGNAVLRLGWEFNGNWFPWSLNAGWPAMGAKAYAADFRHLVTLFRAIPGSHFKFDWTINPGPSASGVPAAEAYPGNKYVTYVGVDFYDSSWNGAGYPIRNAARRWNKLANQKLGLNWWLRFAKAHHKRITVPEWGLNTDQATNGAGDDPSFIVHMYHWFKKNHPAYQIYFDYAGSALNTGADPRASAMYQKLFGRN